MWIEPGLYLVASGAGGFELTDRHDCNVFVFESTAGLVIFDAGAGLATDAVIAAGAATGLIWSKPAHLLLTHGHADHAGGAAALRARLNATTLAGPVTARLVAAGDEAGINLPAARAAGIYPTDYRFTACPIDRAVEDGASFAIGDLEILPIATPGHSADHFSYLVQRGPRRWLVAGDAVFHGGRIALQDTWDCSLQDSIGSLRRLAALEFDALMPGHHLFALQRGRRHVEAALARPARLLPPPQLG